MRARCLKSGVAAAAVCLALCLAQRAAAHDGGEVEARSGPAFPLPAHLDQRFLPQVPVERVISWGAALFSAEYNVFDGAGANLSGDPAGTIRYTRMPRMDLPGFAANPTRTGGPTTQSCTGCHGTPFTGGGGALVDMEIRDPFRSGDPSLYVQRNPLSLFGAGAVQLLAEQTTRELAVLRERALSKARAAGAPQRVRLITQNGVDYGVLTALPDGTLDSSQVRGIHADLIVRPYTWKGSFVTFLRPLVSLGTDTQLGLQAEEFFGTTVDFDGDGVVNEMTVGDITAMTLYIAALPRPVTQLELSRYLGGKYRLSGTAEAAIRRGAARFQEVGCADCHKPAMRLKDPVFREPSRMVEHRFPLLPSGQAPTDVGLDPAHPVRVNLALNPQIGERANDRFCREPRRRDDDVASHRGRARQSCFLQYELQDDHVVVRTYGDLKWHDMGPGLAENVDEAQTGRSVWKTRELWGVGSTGPWLHDGRATTLQEAITWHGGAAQDSRERFQALPRNAQADLVRFLENLVLFRP